MYGSDAAAMAISAQLDACPDMRGCSRERTLGQRSVLGTLTRTTITCRAQGGDTRVKEGVGEDKDVGDDVG